MFRRNRLAEPETRREILRCAQNDNGFVINGFEPGFIWKLTRRRGHRGRTDITA